MGFIPAWAWRWLAIALVFAGAWGAGWFQGRLAGERDLTQYQARVEAEARVAAKRTAEVISQHKAAKEIADAQFEELHAKSNALLNAARLQLAKTRADSRIVPAKPGGTTGDKRICFSDRDELDRGIRELFIELSKGIIGIAEKGQRGVDVAVTCHNWAVSTRTTP